MHRRLIKPEVSNFKTQAISILELREKAPSVFSFGPMHGLGSRYTFVPTTEVLQTLGDRGWEPVDVEEQRVRLTSRIGFQKHLIRFRRAEQMQTLSEWNIELVLTNSHDALSAFVLQIGVFRRICSNGLVVSDSRFEAIRFRHAGLRSAEVIQASERIIEFVPQIGDLVSRFQSHRLTEDEAAAFAANALALRYGALDSAPIAPETLLLVRRPEDAGSDLWTTLNRIQENLIRGGLSDSRRDRRGNLRSVRSLRGITSKVSLNQALWSLAEQVAPERN